jgi:hypothetical protein
MKPHGEFRKKPFPLSAKWRNLFDLEGKKKATIFFFFLTLVCSEGFGLLKPPLYK